MGRLKRQAAEDVFFLRSRCLIGRSSACDLRIDDARVSGEHAGLRWTGTAWELRDLGSTNGTFIRGRRLAPGEHAIIAAGDGFSLGGVGISSLSFTLTEAAPPVASARHVAGGAVRVAAAGLLVLPEDERPQVSLVEAGSGRWVLEAEGEARDVADREIVVVGGEAWSLDLPAPSGPTLDVVASVRSATRPLLGSVEMRFHVSRDEERVEITIVHPDGAIHLPPRSHHYFMLVLARARLADAAAPPAEQGWRDRHELCKMLAVQELRLNVDVCRARKELVAAGIEGGVHVVERRVGTGRIRIGVARLTVERL
ncbi:MAG: FHA domain-containing protein [Polyangiaceae bacterium]|nr:FHA domain-containing protein [Polyangiaceae bacterium]